jgi:hypothetical protein
MTKNKVVPIQPNKIEWVDLVDSKLNFIDAVLDAVDRIVISHKEVEINPSMVCVLIKEAQSRMIDLRELITKDS